VQGKAFRRQTAARPGLLSIGLNGGLNSGLNSGLSIDPEHRP
jgi:hypothetical protein